MRIDEFLAPRILIVAGKGGVGKTTVAAALALVAARRSRRVCIAEVDRKGAVAKLFGARALDYEPREMLPGIWGLTIAPEEALTEYLDVQYHMKRVSKALTHSHFIDYITTAAPGLKDILVLGKVWYLEQGRSALGSSQRFDTIVLDAEAAGHMRTFLASPVGLSDAVRAGPIRRQSDWILEMLRNPRKTRVHLVTLAEEMPVAETLETSLSLGGELRMHQGAVFANAIYSQVLTRSEQLTLTKILEDGDASELLEAAARVGARVDKEDLEAIVGYSDLLNARRAIQARHLRTLRKELGEPVIRLPFLFSAGLSLPDIETIADVIESNVERL